jgi:hypothetical protein
MSAAEMRARATWAAAVCWLACAATGCGDSRQPTQPTDLSVTLSMLIDAVPVGGAAQVTARLTRPGGQAVADGTTVRFTATRGRVDPVDAISRAGTATTTFFAGTQEGPVDITGTSEGAVSAPLRLTVGALGASVTASATPLDAGNVVATAEVTGGTAVLFEWFFERGTLPEVVTTIGTARYTYPTPGFKDFTVRVTLADGRRILGSAAVILEPNSKP